MQPLLHRFPLRKGAHPTRADGLCALEMVAWLAGEAHSDHPRCACPVLAALVRALNDFLPDDESRSRLLRPLIPRLVNSRGSAADERWRGLRIADFAARVASPLTLEARGAHEAAAELRALPAVEDAASAAFAAAALAPHGLRAAGWLLARAAAGAPPERWAAAGAQAARDARHRQAFPATAELVAELAGGRATARKHEG